MTRLALVAALVFSQALFAGHGVVHANGEPADCQICLQACSGGAALPSSEVGPVLTAYAPRLTDSRPLPTATRSLPASHPARAPPFLTA
ncbi:MAG: hypothetical protein R3E50_14765 [Halioglobus sp.]